MFYFLSKTVDFVLMSVGWAFLLLTYAYFTKNRTRSRRAVLAVALILYLFCNNYLVNRAFSWWEYPPVNLSEVSSGYDAGVVLTGGMIRMPDPRSDHPELGAHADRFHQAYHLYKAGKIRRIVISGADDPRAMRLRLDDGHQAALLLEKWGIPARDILLESTSRNTRENALYTAALLREKYPGGKYLLLTSSFHLPRAVGCFRKAGMAVDTFPTDFYGAEQRLTPRILIRPDPESFGYAHLLWREWVGYFAYTLMGYL